MPTTGATTLSPSQQLRGGEDEVAGVGIDVSRLAGGDGAVVRLADRVVHAGFRATSA